MNYVKQGYIIGNVLAGVRMRLVDKIIRFGGILVVGLGVSACATPEVTSGINDPYEARNRRVHQANLKIDQMFFSSNADDGGTEIPKGLLIGVNNFAINWALPSTVVNNLLQLNLEDAAHNTVRFVVNTTIGIGGIFDPARHGGVESRDSDFGETLHVWGAPEGAYVEMPVFGPSTTRDSVGFFVDFVTNPVYLLLPAGYWYVPPVINTAGRVSNRLRYGDSIEALLHDSADSYAQARLLYLESRRFQLGGADATDEELYDIYEETYE